MMWDNIEEKTKEVQFNGLTKRPRTARASSQSPSNQNQDVSALTEHLLQRIAGLEKQMELMTNTWSWRLTIGLRHIRKWLSICKRQLVARVR